jgi:hypothetical protein
MVLVKVKIAEFTLEGYVFRNLSQPDISNKMTPGFYNILIEEGDVSILVKRAKREKGNGVQFHQKGLVFLEDITKYYLKKDGNFFEVKNHKNIVKLLSTKKGKEPKIRVTREMTREQRMINVVKEYNRMKNER